ncbi:TetR family transcriptional regulator [Streptomyces sp. SID4919]|uniref:TetR family transcriptional regulator n=1 Tax=Streptomyces uncialis TaxID=1048205 RepID=A0A1Q4V253_9ACTN|nr:MULTISPECIES: TetR/AcrR family transcriptional regulator [Streptomyces]MCX4664396.1 TetR/AcrR family transcriptional regulator [Streptomyces uncialis]MYY10934.1 TetR family transcriptional regulator [Streptomyces sp. SID4919]OKH91918.1 TetR family transcriptional regulator [Streptomyces uncialis]WST69962.1 TetR/AcrR family transcriptional regulator [Streptomyces uncialis]WTE11404.1 TetR/AcrR family transcriptional regulator [Streptomyces uncialis]
MSAAADTPARPPARTRILDAAHELMLGVGMARTTTKEIARAADCSEAALYKHFTGKEDLFVAVLAERLPRLGPLMAELAREPGVGSVEDNLTGIVRTAALFYEQSFPIAASLYAETHLKRRHESALREVGAGPHLPIDGLAAYLLAEQRGGRVRADADPYTAAALLMGACCQRAFAYDATESGASPQSLDTFARTAARTVLTGLAPTPG